MTKIFTFNPEDYRDEYRENRFVHIKGAVTQEFLQHVRDFVAEEKERLSGVAIGGAMAQTLFRFPEDADFPGELFDAVATVCGLNRPSMTLSERHIKAYDHDARPEPRAHKDRYASQASVGFSIDIPEGSRLVLYPHDDVWPNPFNVSSQLVRELPEHRLPENVLKGAREVEIYDEPGDLVMFPGSATWHKRRNSANAVNLYCKFNDFHQDPLGEDPSTEERRQRTLAALARGDEQGLVLAPSRRLDLVSRHRTRMGEEVLQANLGGEQPFNLTEVQYRALQEIGSGASADALVDRLITNGNRAAVHSEVRYLIEWGALDLVSSDEISESSQRAAERIVG
jgi:virulence-associated protein VagC